MFQVPRIVHFLVSTRNSGCCQTYQGGNGSLWRRPEEFLRQHRNTSSNVDPMVKWYCCQRSSLGIWELGLDFDPSKEYPSLLPLVPSIYAPNYCLPQIPERCSSRTIRCWWRYLYDEAASMLVAQETSTYVKKKNPSSTISQMGSRHEQEQKLTARSALTNHFPLVKRCSESPWYTQIRCQVYSKTDWNHQKVGRMGEAGRGKPCAQRRSIQTVQDAWRRK